MGLTALSVEIRSLQKALVELGTKHAAVVIPGYTHLQRAQPVYFAHHLLAYVEMLGRDQGRLADCARRANVCPLGAGALAGSRSASLGPSLLPFHPTLFASLHHQLPLVGLELPLGDPQRAHLRSCVTHHVPVVVEVPAKVEQRDE